MTTPVSIPIDKSKLLVNLSVLIYFVFYISFLMYSNWRLGLAQGDSISGALPTALFFFGYLIVVLAIVIAFKWDSAYALFWLFVNNVKLLDPRPGLTISDSGIVDNSSITACGEVPWDWVTDIQYVGDGPARGVSVYLSLEQATGLIERHGGVKRRLLKLNNTVFGTPVFLAAGNLKVPNDKLMEKLTARFRPVRERRHESDTPLEAYLVSYVESQQ